VTRTVRRRTLEGVLILMAVAAGLLVLLGLTGSSGAAARSESSRVAAGREAGRLLTAVRLPAPAPPASAAGEAPDGLARIIGAGAPNVAARSASWRVPEPTAAVRAFLAAHPPGGTFPAPGTALSFAPLRLGRGLASARLSLTVLSAGPRTSVVVAEARVRWLMPRPATERVPAGAAELEILRGPRGARPSLVVRVTSRARIARIRALLDRLPPVQPGVVYHCPAQVPEVPVVRFIFRTGGGRARVLAVAGEQADVRSPTTACDAMSFSLAGRAQTPLLGGFRLLRQVSALLGRRLWTVPYAA
jgi:hypothetical protein